MKLCYETLQEQKVPGITSMPYLEWLEVHGKAYLPLQTSLEAKKRWSDPKLKQFFSLLSVVQFLRFHNLTNIPLS